MTRKNQLENLSVSRLPFSSIKKPAISIFKKSGVVNVEIETNRLFIRSYRETDFEDCVLLYGDKLITKYFDHGNPRNRNQVRELIQERGDKYFSTGKPFGLFSVYLKESMDFIGQVDFIPSDEAGVVEIGFILHDRYHNQGLCTEAVSSLVFDYTELLNRDDRIECDDLPVNKIIATAHPKNKSSRRVLEKLGMTLDKIQDRFGAPRLWFSILVSLIDKKIGSR
jgi:RimJ/RimL family protein N-acetyltransferase